MIRDCFHVYRLGLSKFLLGWLLSGQIIDSTNSYVRSTHLFQPSIPPLCYSSANYQYVIVSILKTRALCFLAVKKRGSHLHPVMVSLFDHQKRLSERTYCWSIYEDSDPPVPAFYSILEAETFFSSSVILKSQVSLSRDLSLTPELRRRNRFQPQGKLSKSIIDA